MPSALFPRRTLLAALALLVLGSLLPAACAEPTPPTPAPAAAPIRIVCTTAMIGDIVRRVAGDRAKVEVLMGPGTDPHLYKPTRTDIAKLSSADVVFYNGLLLEGKLTETFDRLASNGKRVHAVTQRLTESDLLTKDQPGPAGGAPGAAHTPAGDAVPTDPHAWMNPRLWSEAVQTVRLKLAELDPAHADGYASRADTLKAELAELDAYAEKVLSSVPETSRVLVTAHDAFNYFAKRYSFRVEGVQGI
ncbi:MAG: zinc ABC transporter substrate-binding protein, partial [Phycisphaerales bacterium]|nr:zinc ABC transporter substrate-binding protein [Phycisphaerales bacterium]